MKNLLIFLFLFMTCGIWASAQTYLLESLSGISTDVYHAKV